MKKTIKIKFVDFWAHWNENDNFIVNALKKHYNVEFSECPDYVFFSNFSKRLEHMNYENAVKIFYTQENLCPDFNFADYGIGFEHIIYGDRYLNFPIAFIEERYGDAWRGMLKKHLNLSSDVCEKRGFCSFVVSNGEADKIRDAFFEKLCTYKKVDSGGRYKNNIGQPNGVPDKLAFAGKYKFSLCFENSSHPGYFTEKLVEGFAAKTVPIYWGDPCIGEVFNEKAFINLSKLTSMEDMLEAVRRVDEDDDLYMRMLNEPALNESSSDLFAEKQKELENFLMNIIEQPKKSAYRRNRVFWGQRYCGLYKKMRNFYVLFFQNKAENAVMNAARKLKRKLKG